MALFLLLAGCPGPKRVVHYSAQDKEFAEQILADFEKGTTLPVTAHYDSEANKSVGLLDDLIREAKQPHCDVHWNNEILGTIRLQLGILEPYDSPAAKPFPSACRGSDHTWTAFAARARVLVLNTKLLQERGIAEAQWPKSLLDLAQEGPSGHEQISRRHQRHAGGVPVSGLGQRQGHAVVPRLEGQRHQDRSRQQASG